MRRSPCQLNKLFDVEVSVRSETLTKNLKLMQSNHEHTGCNVDKVSHVSAV
jgi:hypothetical protein